MSKKGQRWLGVAVVLGCWAFSAAAQEPSGTLRLLVGFAAGGSSDTVARIMAPKLSEALHQSVVIDNKPGAGGSIATEALIKANPDGNTIMLGTVGSLAVNQHLTRLSHDPVAEVTPLSMAVVFSNVLVVPASSDIRNLDDYIRQGRQDKTRLSFGSSGIGSSGHLAGELLKSMAGLQIQHVSYRGGAPAMNDLLAGVLPSIFSSPTDAVQHIQSGRLRARATTGRQRMEVLPQIPTIDESGYPGFDASNWYAFVAPLRMAPAQVQRLQQAIAITLNDPGVVAQLRKNGLEPSPSSPQEAARYIRAESDKWARVIRNAKIRETP